MPLRFDASVNVYAFVDLQGPCSGLVCLNLNSPIVIAGDNAGC